MADLTGTIARFITPSDGIGSAHSTMIDWANSRFYTFNSLGSRRYALDWTATQSPALSVSPTPNPGFEPYGTGIDSNGFVIWQGASSNSAAVLKLDPATLAVVGSYGVYSSALGGYPTAIDACQQQIICITCNGVPYALCKSLVSARCGIIRTDNMTQAGAVFSVSNGYLGHSWVTAGAQGTNSAVAYFLDQAVAGAVASLSFWSITILKGAENYNPAFWPVTNPDISSKLIANIAASTVDPTWTTMTSKTLGYDQKSGLCLADVVSGTATVVNRYLLGLSPANGAIVWRFAFPSGSYPMDHTISRISNGQVPYLQEVVGTSAIYGIQAQNGTFTLNDVKGVLAEFVPGFQGSVYDDTNQVFVIYCGLYSESASSPQPVDAGTPDGFSGLAMLKVWPPFPPTGSDSATVADLFFAATSGFVDLTSAANRRLFVSASGAAQDLGSDGSSPFQATPPVFLTSNGTPSTFANNNGRGGAFPLTTGSLTNGASNPPGATETTTTYGGLAAGSGGIVGDYLTGNIYAWNPATLTDNGTRKVWRRRWRGLPKASEDAKRFASLVIGMQTGINIPEGTAPQVMLRWSDDDGSTWSDQRIVAVGGLGKTVQTVKFNRLGMTRRFGGSDRIFELTAGDYFEVAILDAEVDVS